MSKQPTSAVVIKSKIMIEKKDREDTPDSKADHRRLPAEPKSNQVHVVRKFGGIITLAELFSPDDLGAKPMTMGSLDLRPRQLAQFMEGIGERGFLLGGAFRQGVITAEMFQAELGAEMIRRSIGRGGVRGYLRTPVWRLGWSDLLTAAH